MSILQIFWKVDCCSKFLFLEVATSDLHHTAATNQVLYPIVQVKFEFKIKVLVKTGSMVYIWGC